MLSKEAIELFRGWVDKSARVLVSSPSGTCQIVDIATRDINTKNILPLPKPT